MTSINYTPAEDRANTASAAAGLAGLAIFGPMMFYTAHQTGDGLLVAGTAIFLATAVFLYLTSTLYHALAFGRVRSLARLMDHCAIFFLIAGTYTPLCVGPLRESDGWVLLACEWTLAAVGVAIKVCGGMRYRMVSNMIYLGMGWLGLIWMKPLIAVISWEGFLWILGGGVLYTVGTVFYLAKSRPYAHVVWHCFVLAGTGTHAYGIWRYVLQ